MNHKVKWLDTTTFQFATMTWHMRHFGSAVPAWKPYVKTVEELGEVGRALNLEDVEGVAREIGDVVIAISVVAGKFGIDLGEAVTQRWDEILKRPHERVTEQYRPHPTPPVESERPS